MVMIPMNRTDTETTTSLAASLAQERAEACRDVCQWCVECAGDPGYTVERGCGESKWTVATWVHRDTSGLGPLLRCRAAKIRERIWLRYETVIDTNIET